MSERDAGGPPNGFGPLGRAGAAALIGLSVLAFLVGASVAGAGASQGAVARPVLAIGATAAAPRSDPEGAAARVGGPGAPDAAAALVDPTPARSPGGDPGSSPVMLAGLALPATVDGPPSARVIPVQAGLWGGGYTRPVVRWTIFDLGRTETEEHCMEAGQDALGQMGGWHGAERLWRTDWTVHLDRLANQEVDLAIICTYGAARGTRATLVIHHPPGALGKFYARSIETAFRRRVETLTEEHRARLD